MAPDQVEQALDELTKRVEALEVRCDQCKATIGSRDYRLVLGRDVLCHKCSGRYFSSRLGYAPQNWLAATNAP